MRIYHGQSASKYIIRMRILTMNYGSDLFKPGTINTLRQALIQASYINPESKQKYFQNKTPRCRSKFTAQISIHK